METVIVTIMDTNYKEHEVWLDIDFEGWMDQTDHTDQITEAATLWCSDNGYGYETWRE